MPNYIFNQATITGPQNELSRFQELVKTEDQDFSFQRIIPKPESLNITMSSDTEKALIYALWKNYIVENETIPEGVFPCVDEYGFKGIWNPKTNLPADNWVVKLCEEYNFACERFTYLQETNADEAMKFLEIGKTALKNILQYGAMTWYDWSCENWGTKWDAGDVSLNMGSEGIQLSFQTAWSTPEPIWAKLAELFPSLEFHIRFADEDIGSNCGCILLREGKGEIEYINTFEFACDVWGIDPNEFV